MSSKQPYRYDDDTATALAEAMSTARFTTYLDVAGTEQRACQLYTWNTAVSAALYGPLQAVEVVLRNAVHQSLSATHGQRWFKDGTVLRPPDVREVDSATQRLYDKGKQPAPGRVIAEMSLGFWVGLFANAYDETLWRTHLHRMFSPRPKRRHELFEMLDRLRTLRNRIAHHEPIFQRRLRDDYDRLVRITSALHPPTCRWLEHHSTVPEVLETKPPDITRF